MTKHKQKGQWPNLNYNKLKDTLLTVQLWSQIVGKIRLVSTPWINHGWNVTLYTSPRGLTTGLMPYAGGAFQIDFDFIDHRLSVTSSNGGSATMNLQPGKVSDFYNQTFNLLEQLGIHVVIYAKPNEMAEAVPFAEDHADRIYDKQQIHNYWQALIRIEAVLTRFRAGFNGKCSPVHLYWGEFDLAVSLFSGRKAPVHHGTMPNMPESIMQEAYSHEVAGAGFWGGSESHPYPSFYAYCYPAAPDYGTQTVLPAAAAYHTNMGEYILNYDAVQKADDPEATLLQFLQTTFNAAVKTGHWSEELSYDLTATRPTPIVTGFYEL
ncbi:DUF5996 family protein [Mucilaginibacter gynuensis]|uniref:DUF5996 family protein n=1 Tax=Mucilaginibacter gynuensis TaxID=1302236 RepID=A0ABP8GFR5_9SPHI